MIANNSRIKSFRACRTKTYAREELRLAPRREDSNLLIGGGFHAGMAMINAKGGDIDQCVKAAEDEFTKRSDWDNLLKEERDLYQKDLTLIKGMVRAYGSHYLTENFAVLHPEVAFRVPLPNSTHHCWYVHRLIYPNDLWHARLDFEGINKDESQHFCDDPRCYIPHYLVGTTDAVIHWSKAIWLQEHKTTAYDLNNSDGPQAQNYIKNWYLDDQATTYIYGIWKATGVRPHGVLLNAIIKPRKNAVTPKFSFFREAFIRSDADLARFEVETVRQLNEFETSMRTGNIYMNPQSCFNYFRTCEYWKSCTSHEFDPSAYAVRKMDYVNLAYYKLLNLTPPAIEQEDPIEDQVAGIIGE